MEPCSQATEPEMATFQRLFLVTSAHMRRTRSRFLAKSSSMDLLFIQVLYGEQVILTCNLARLRRDVCTSDLIFSWTSSAPFCDNISPGAGSADSWAYIE